MSVSKLVPEVWTASILRNFEKSTVFGNLLNRDYTGDLSYGNKVFIPRILPVAARPYSDKIPIQYDDIQSSMTELEIDQQSYFAIKAFDIEEVQAKPKFLDSATKNGGYALRDTIDKFCAGVIENGAGIKIGSKTTPISLHSKNILEQISLISQRFNENNIPENGRWLVLPPWTYRTLQHANIALSSVTPENKIITEGFISRSLGFDIYVSNNVPTVQDEYSAILAGTEECGSLVMQIEKLEELRDKDFFASLIRALSVYGSSITQPSAAAVLYVEEAAS
ncbi:MAG: hypothetical protein FWB86_05260 [Treponema sp.]|nr:hypothetical protein [Treponema sp.]